MFTPPKRPWSVTWLTLGVLSLTAIHILRAVNAAVAWPRLEELTLSVNPGYLLASGLAWGLGGLALAWGLWRGSRWAPRAMRVATLLYMAYYWVDRLALASNPLRPTNQVFYVVASVSVLGIIFWILWRPSARAYFGDRYE